MALRPDAVHRFIRLTRHGFLRHSAVGTRGRSPMKGLLSHGENFLVEIHPSRYSLSHVVRALLAATLVGPSSPVRTSRRL